MCDEKIRPFDPVGYAEALLRFRTAVEECAPLLHYGVAVTSEQAARDEREYLQALRLRSDA
ncbi:MAG TPA: hypothetical protein VGP70_07585 [Actinomadura sp.]|nr:hypothetical protein [Actinomadura sp.]